MSRSVTSSGKTIDEAIDNALKILGKSKEEVNIKVTQQPEAGVFGLFGKKDAIVEVTTIDIIENNIPEPTKTVVPQEVIQEEIVDEVVNQPNNELISQKEQKAIEFLNEMFETMGLEVDIDSHFDGEFLRIDLTGPKMGILIGRRGQTLDAIQYLTSLVINKNSDDYTRLIIDTENYREKRKKTLEDLADKMANKALRFRRRVSLEPMNPAERRIIHARLQKNRDVYTYSEGQDPYRRVVIQLNR